MLQRNWWELNENLSDRGKTDVKESEHPDESEGKKQTQAVSESKPLLCDYYCSQTGKKGVL